MAKKIENKDLFSDDVLLPLIERYKQLLELAKEFKKEGAGTAKELMQSMKGNKLKSAGDVKKFNKEKKESAKVIDELNALEKEELTLQKKLADAQKKHAKINADLRDELNKLNKETRDSVKFDKTKEGSLARMRLELARNKRAYTELSEAERNAKDIGGQLLKTIKKQTDEVKALEEEMGVFSRNVGNYAESVKSAIDESDTLNTLMNNQRVNTGALSDAITKLVMIKGILLKIYKNTKKNVAEATAAQVQNKVATQGQTKAQIALSKATLITGKSFKVLKAAIAGSGIGLIIVALGALVTVFTRLQSGIDAAGGAMEGIGQVMNVLIGRLGKLGLAIVDVVQGTVAAAKALGQAVKGNFSEAGKLMDKAGEEFDSAGERFTKAFEGVGAEIAEAFEFGQALYNLKKAAREADMESKKLIATLSKEEEKLQAIADDTTRSFKEREDALLQARDIAIAKANEEIAIAKRQLKVIQEENAMLEKKGLLRSEGEEKEEELEALLAVMEAEKNLQNAVMANERERREIKQDRIENELDFEQDLYQTQARLNEQIINDELLTFSKRRDMLEETRRLAESSFKAQEEALQEFTNGKLNLSELVAMTDEREVIAKMRALGLSEKIEKALLKAIKERRDALKDLGEWERDMQRQRIELELKYTQALEDLRAVNIDDEIKEQEEIERLNFERIKAQIEQEYSVLKSKEDIDALIQEAEKQHQEKLNDIRLKAFDKESALRQKQLELQMLRDGATEKQISDQMRAQKIEDLKKEIELRKSIGMEVIDQELELAKLERDIANETKQLNIKAREEAMKAVSDIIKKEIDAQLDKIQKEIDATKGRQETLMRLAEQGQLDAQQSLAEEQKREAELELKKEKMIKRQAQLEAGLAALNQFNANVDSGSKAPLAKTIADITALYAFINGLPGFYKGTEYLSDEAAQKGRDKILIRADEGERIFSAEQNKRIGNIGNEEATRVLNAYTSGALSNIAEVAHNKSSSIMIETAKLEKKVDELITVTRNKPVQQIHPSVIKDALFNEKIIQGQKVINRHHKKQQLLFRGK